MPRIWSRTIFVLPNPGVTARASGALARRAVGGLRAGKWLFDKPPRQGGAPQRASDAPPPPRPSNDVFVSITTITVAVAITYVTPQIMST